MSKWGPKIPPAPEWKGGIEVSNDGDYVVFSITEVAKHDWVVVWTLSNHQRRDVVEKGKKEFFRAKRDK